MSENCDYLLEDFCIFESETGAKCPYAKIVGDSILESCTAKPEDLIEYWEECEYCEGPDPKDPEDGPSCPLFAWEFCEHMDWWKPERLSAFRIKDEPLNSSLKKTDQSIDHSVKSKEALK